MKRLRPPTSPRWRGKLIVFVLLGAIVNVAVAWGFGLFSKVNDQSGDLFDDSTALRGTLGLEAIEPDPGGYAIRGPGLTVAVVHDGISFSRGGTSLNVSYATTGIDFRGGWPARSLRCGIVEHKGSTQYRDAIVARAMSASSTSVMFGVLPYKPLWPGFAINTIFYAAILWLLFAAPFALRRRRRIKRGLCPACAYPIGASDKCTECGAALAQMSAQFQSAQFKPAHSKHPCA